MKMINNISISEIGGAAYAYEENSAIGRDMC